MKGRLQAWRMSSRFSAVPEIRFSHINNFILCNAILIRQASTIASLIHQPPPPSAGFSANPASLTVTMAFILFPTRIPNARTVQQSASPKQFTMSAAGERPPVSRRAFITTTAAVALSQVVPNLLPKVANAAVSIDIERFGDKGTQYH